MKRNISHHLSQESAKKTVTMSLFQLGKTFSVLPARGAAHTATGMQPVFIAHKLIPRSLYHRRKLTILRLCHQ